MSNYKEPFNFDQVFSLYYWKLQFFKATGGRPMKYIGISFYDKVSGKQVRYYVDKFGRKWMADSGSWSFFRVRVND